MGTAGRLARRTSAVAGILTVSSLVLAGCSSPAADSRGLDGGDPSPMTSASAPSDSPATAAPPASISTAPEASAVAPLPSSMPAPAQDARLAAPKGDPWVVSVGDSYISGEAGRWAGNESLTTSDIDALGPAAYADESGSEAIARCHRSRSAAIHIGVTPSKNLACSGATTSTHFEDDGTFKPGIDFYSSNGRQGQALMLQDFATTHRVAMVAMSIGGNDFKFAPIIEECIKAYLKPSFFGSYCHDDKTVGTYIDDAAANRVRSDVSRAILNVAKAMEKAGYSDSEWRLVMQLYPDAIARPEQMRYPESGYDRQLVGGCGFRDDDSAWALDTVIPLINRTILEAEAEAHDQRPSLQMSTMTTRGAFARHALCDRSVSRVGARGGANTWQDSDAVDKSEWVMEINMVNPFDTYQQESVHPNYWGQLALRSCWRQAWNNGQPHGGACEVGGSGLSQYGEPVMVLK